jgi:hypothetical protein
MGRAAIHSGKLVIRDEAMASNFQWCPAVDMMTDKTPPPVEPDENGRYAAPCPGEWVEL